MDGPEPQAVIELDEITKTFPLRRGRPVTALRRLSLSVRSGEFVALVGPSGCGKSTVIRLIAGLEQPTQGTVRVEGRPAGELAREHRLGIAFQDHALLPWASAAQNIALPYRIARRPVDHAHVGELLELVGLDEFKDVRPGQLSGGMRQRVCLARALVLDPDVLLLDEPFGSLDAVTRARMNAELSRIWSARQVTTVLVTHDVREAVFLADRVIALTARPGTVRAVEHVPFTRPRTPELTRDEAFHRIADTVAGLLEHELSRTASEGEGPA